MVGTDLSTDSTLESGDVGQWSRSDLVIVCTPGSISNTSISRPFHIAAIKKVISDHFQNLGGSSAPTRKE